MLDGQGKGWAQDGLGVGKKVSLEMLEAGLHVLSSPWVPEACGEHG